MDADYIMNHYGTCSAEPCHCRLKGPWLGPMCPNWTPVQAKSLEQLKNIAKKQYRKEE